MNGDVLVASVALAAWVGFLIGATVGVFLC